MNMDFKSAKELLALCAENALPISEVMRRRECLLGEVEQDAVDRRMAKAWDIMRASATQPLETPIKSMGGLIGGEAKTLQAHAAEGKGICGDVLQKAMTYAMAVLEVNASMGLIVAAPRPARRAWCRACCWPCRSAMTCRMGASWMRCSTPVRWATLPCATPPWPVPWAAVRPR